MTSSMRIQERRAGEVTVLQVTGRLELEEGDLVLRDCVDRLVRDDRMHLLVDLRGVTRIDSAGLGMLVAKLLTVRRRGGEMKLLSPTPRSLSLLTLTKLSSIFEIFEDEGAALGSFASRPPAH